MILHALGGISLLFGAAFVLVAALGVLRLPDLLMRMHASTKAGTLGAGMILLAVAFFYGEIGVTTRAIATIAFLVLTAPVAAHMIGRAAYFLGIELWPGTIVDDLKAHIQDPKRVSSHEDAAPTGDRGKGA